jgi:hypothetical protein
MVLRAQQVLTVEGFALFLNVVDESRHAAVEISELTDSPNLWKRILEEMVLVRGSSARRFGLLLQLPDTTTGITNQIPRLGVGQQGSMALVHTHTVDQLRTHLNERGVDSRGKKKDLTGRVLAAVRADDPNDELDSRTEEEEEAFVGGEVQFMTGIQSGGAGVAGGAEAVSTTGIGKLFKVVYGNSRSNSCITDLVYVGNDGSLASTDPFFANMGMPGKAMVTLLASGKLAFSFTAHFHTVYLRDQVLSSLLLTGEAASTMTLNFTVMCDGLSVNKPADIDGVLIPKASVRWNTAVLVTHCRWENTSTGFAGNVLDAAGMDFDAPFEAAVQGFNPPRQVCVRDIEEMARTDITRTYFSQLQPILFAHTEEMVHFYSYINQCNERQKNRVMTKDTSWRLAFGDKALHVAFVPSSNTTSERSAKRILSISEKKSKGEGKEKKRKEVKG